MFAFAYNDIQSACYNLETVKIYEIAPKTYESIKDPLVSMLNEQLQIAIAGINKLLSGISVVNDESVKFIRELKEAIDEQYYNSNQAKGQLKNIDSQHSPSPFALKLKNKHAKLLEERIQHLIRLCTSFQEYLFLRLEHAFATMLISNLYGIYSIFAPHQEQQQSVWIKLYLRINSEGIRYIPNIEKVTDELTSVIESTPKEIISTPVLQNIISSLFNFVINRNPLLINSFMETVLNRVERYHGINDLKKKYLDRLQQGLLSIRIRIEELQPLEKSYQEIMGYNNRPFGEKLQDIYAALTVVREYQNIAQSIILAPFRVAFFQVDTSLLSEEIKSIANNYSFKLAARGLHDMRELLNNDLKKKVETQYNGISSSSSNTVMDFGNYVKLMESLREVECFKEEYFGKVNIIRNILKLGFSEGQDEKQIENLFEDKVK